MISACVSSEYFQCPTLLQIEHLEFLSVRPEENALDCNSGLYIIICPTRTLSLTLSLTSSEITTEPLSLAAPLGGKTQN
jgi:hypothetical protein